jgi:uncharacterized protein YprB with RNaseH-like and TPR domain
MGLADRLRRLRREGGGESVPAEKVVRVQAETTACEVPTTTGSPAGLVPATGPDGEYLARSTWYERDARHGRFALSEIDHADSGDYELLTGDLALAELDLSRAVYLDTETTGLSGGAGTYVFMVGLGRFEERAGGTGFCCWQGFLDGPEDEAALLAECAERIRASSGVVSFFGKSFDRHRLEDKMRLVGVEPPFEAVPHLDLYHPCRRLYRTAYADGRLKTMECELCGVEREDDLPGAFAPAAWFDYLGKRPHRLEGVFRHNRDDVLSLVTLAAHLGAVRRERRADGTPLGGDGTTRALGLARSNGAVGAREAALQWFERALERDARPRRSVLLERAELLRLMGRHSAAIHAYRELVSGDEDHCSAPALLELAKLLEHRTKDFAGALECCRAARTLLDRNHTGAEYGRLLRDLEHRAGRLAQKS